MAETVRKLGATPTPERAATPQWLLGFGIGFLLGILALAGVLLLGCASAHAQTISHVSGGGLGDGGPVAEGSIDAHGLAWSPPMRLFAADAGNKRARELDFATNRITSELTGLFGPQDVEAAPNGLYVSDGGVVWFVPDTGAPPTRVVTGLSSIFGLETAHDGALLIVDMSGLRIWRWANGQLTPWAGTGQFGFAGDGGPKEQARFNFPTDIVRCTRGAERYYLVSDTQNARVRKINHDTGIITSVAGIGQAGTPVGGTPAASTAINQPRGLACASDGTFYIAEQANCRVTKVDPNGILTVLVGRQSACTNSGNGGDVSSATLDKPWGLALSGDGSQLYVSAGSGQNGRVRMVDLGAAPQPTITSAPQPTATRTATLVPPTVPPTHTRTWTPVPATATRTHTPRPTCNPECEG